MMKSNRFPLRVFSSLMLFMITFTAYAQNKVVAYVPNWIDLNSFSNSIQYSKLTHINIAFENLYNDNGDLSFNNQNNVLINRAHANGLKVLISIGGGAASGDQVLTNRYFTQISSSRRAAFVDKISAYVSSHNFDGIDVDLEGPSINGDYGAFIQVLSNKLKPQGKLVTAALSQGYGGDKVPSSTFQYFDFINIMAYDGKGYWNPNDPGNHSTLAFAKSNTQYWLNRGLPKSKAVLGVPFYGYGFGSAFRNRDYSYKDIVNAYPGAENVDQVGSTIWYNGIPTIKAKTNYAFDLDIGGIMIWSLDYDVPGARSLLSAIDQVFKDRSVQVPQGPYNNVRVNLPGKLEAENYDVGGQNVAYNDGTDGNSGTVYRTDHVDIQATTDAGAGHNIGWTTTGEWLEYSINVMATGSYNVAFRSASTAVGAIRMEIDGADVTGSVALPNTTGYQVWETTSKNNVALTAGNHVLRLSIVTGGFNLNYIEVTPSNQAPTVTLTSPVAGANYTAPAIVAIAANSSDADGSVSKVEFFNGATKLGEDISAPYTFSWTNVAAGTYSVTARATDNNGATATSSAVSVLVKALPPCVPVTASADDGNVAANVLDNNLATRWSASGDGQWIQFCLETARSISGIQIAFYNGNIRQSIFDIQSSADGLAWSNIATGLRSSGTSTALESFSFATQSVKFLRIVGHGNSVNAWNSYTEVKIEAGLPVNKVPIVSITSPSNNTSFVAPATINVTANASDVDGMITKVEFYNGTTLLGTDLTAPYSLELTGLAVGSYSFAAKASDDSNAVSTSSVVNVSVNPILPNQAPTVQITSPSNNAAFTAPATIVINAAASDADGLVSKVEFFNGTMKLGEDLVAPYSFTWTNVAVGNYSLTAKATDNAGTSTTSAFVSVRVNASTNLCSGIPTYSEAAGYNAGSIVQSAGKRYQCKPYPYAGWCNGASWAYGPGTGAYWSDAWTLLGNCTNARSTDDASTETVLDELLISNAPNPFTGITSVNVMVTESGNVSVKVYDIAGLLVGTVAEGYLNAGSYTFDYDASNLKSNVYLMKYSSESGSVVRKIMKTE